MTAKEKVLAVYPDAFAMRCWIGCWHVKRDKNDNQGLSKLENAVTITTEEAAWQNAAESLPAQTEQTDEIEHIHALIREADEEAKTTSANGANWRGFVESLREPVAPVEANEKCGVCNKPIEKIVGKECCRHVLAENESYIAQYSMYPECFNKPVPAIPAEPKPTPSTSALNVTPTFGRPTVEEILEEWADGRAYGENSHFIKEFSRHALTYIESLKPQPDSSSIPDEDEIWDSHSELIETISCGMVGDETLMRRSEFNKAFKKMLKPRDSFDVVLVRRAQEYGEMAREHKQKEEYDAALTCEDKRSGLFVAAQMYRKWAKGQSNGR